MAWTPERLADLPIEGGFRLRGEAQTRSETFADAAFAFGATLLVVSSQPARSFADLMGAMRAIPAFGAAFAMLLLFWLGHRRFSRRYGLEDGWTVMLSVALVFVVLIYVFPLKFMVGVFMGWLSSLGSGVYPDSAPQISGSQLYPMFAIYGAGYTALCAILMLMYARALRVRISLGLSEVEAESTRAAVTAWGAMGAVGLASIALALLTPPSRFAWPGWVYVSLSVIMPVLGMREDRRRKDAVAREGGP
ncbi:MAG: DUF1211 domain-containing protein [Phycisphaeraceae bacterium]|nr:DUF1211 domain-containing protein [Phycisphaeraceae bacterium]